MGNALKMVLTVSNQNLLKKEARLKRTGQKTQMKSWPPTWLNVRPGPHLPFQTETMFLAPEKASHAQTMRRFRPSAAACIYQLRQAGFAPLRSQPCGASPATTESLKVSIPRVADETREIAM
jgi:hypothetical protein